MSDGSTLKGLEGALRGELPAAMRDVVLFTLGETRCAVWRDQISSVEDVGSLHRFPFLKTSLNVLAVIGDRTRTLADLPACLGFGPTKERSGARALLMSDQEPIQGFVVTGHQQAVQVRPETVVPVPGSLSLPAIQGCLDLDGRAILILDIAALYDMVKDGSREIAAAASALPAAVSWSEPQMTDLRAVKAGGCVLALSTAGVQRSVLSGYHVVDFPLLPRDIDGIAVFPDRMLPIVDLRSRIFPEAPPGTPVALEVALGSGSAALLVDEDGGEWSRSDSRVRELPPVTQSAWLHSAAVRNGEIAGLLDLPALLSGRNQAGEPNLTARHKPDSAFPSQFEREDVRVVEFMVHGRRHAVPESEVHAVIPAEPYQPVPRSPRIIAGVSDYEDALLPVLDFARLYEEGSPAQTTGSMVVIANGGFRALVLSEQVFDARSVRREEQREVPVALPYPVVYGCYTAGESVRLIFNIEALAAYSDEARVAEFMTALAPLQQVEPEVVRTPSRPQAVEEPVETIVKAVAEKEPEVEAPVASEEKPLPEWIEISEPLVTAAAPPEPPPAPAPTPPPAPQPESPVVPVAEVSAPPAAEPTPPTAEELGIAEAPSLEEPEILEPPPAEATAASEQMAAAHSSSEIRSALEASLGEQEEAPKEQATELEHAGSPTEPAPTEPEVTAAEEAALVEPAPRPDRTWGRRLLGFVISAIVIAALGIGLYSVRGFAQRPPAPVAAALAAPAPKPTAAAPAPAPASQPEPAPAPSAPPAVPKPAPAAEQPASSMTFYVVKEGDTLWDISNRLTGDPFNYRMIAGQNRIQNPDLIFPGQEIQTPH